MLETNKRPIPYISIEQYGFLLYSGSSSKYLDTNSTEILI